MPLFSLRGHPRTLGVHQGKLSPCPASPNCVCSDDSDPVHQTAALELAENAEKVWSGIRRIISAMPGTRIVTSTPDYLHAECTSAVFGFVDDLELLLRKDEGMVAVRSASRLGYYDFGVNRRRVEKLRAILKSGNTGA